MRAGPSIAAITVIPPTCRSRHRGPGCASRCGGSTAATRPADAAPSPRRLRTSSHRTPGARGGLARRRPGSASPAAVQAARVFSRTSTCRQAARPYCGSSPACRCPTRRLPSGSASTTGRSGRAAVTARSSPHHRSPPGSHSTHGGRLARTASQRRTRRPGSLDRVRPRRKPRRAPGATGRRSMAPSHQHAAGRRTLAPRCPCPVAEPSPPPWLGRSSRPARPCLGPQHAGTGSGGTEPDEMAGCPRRGPPPAPAGSPCSRSPVPWG